MITRIEIENNLFRNHFFDNFFSNAEMNDINLEKIEVIKNIDEIRTFINVDYVDKYYKMLKI